MRRSSLLEKPNPEENTGNTVVNQLFGTVTGLGMGVLTFDWAQISFMGSPMLVPWWASVQAFAGFVLFYWVILPILYYTNVGTAIASNLPSD